MHPTLIPERRLIANVEGAMNAVLVKGDAVGATLYYGDGAGAEPTASAVVADLVDVTRMHTADPQHRVPHLAFQPDQLADTPILPMDEVHTAYYLRLRAFDKPGVLADITRILADSNISIDAMMQKEPAEGEEQADLILLTHLTRREEHQRGDRQDRGAGHRGGQGDAHPPGRTGGQMHEIPQHPRRWRRNSASPKSCSAAWPAMAACICRRPIRASRAPNWTRCAA